MNQDINNKLLNLEVNEEYKEDLSKLTNDLNFEFKYTKVKTETNSKTNRNTTHVIFSTKDPDNPNIATYTRSKRNLSDFTMVTLQSGNTINFSAKTSRVNNKQTIDYFKGYIKIPNDGIYIFTLSRENNLIIKYYDYKYFYDHLEQKPNLFLYLNNLTFHNIEIEPTISSTLNIDITSCPLEAINYLFRNRQLIIDAITNEKQKNKIH